MSRVLEHIDKWSVPPYLYDQERFYTCNNLRLFADYVASLAYTNDDFHCQLYADWTSTVAHPLNLAFMIKGDDDTKLRYFDLVLLEVLREHLAFLEEITVVLSVEGDILQVYLVNLEISHDDYIELCLYMRSACEKDDVRIYIPSGYPVPCRDNLPLRLIHVRFESELDGVSQPRQVRTLEWRPAEEDDTFFDKIANHEDRWKEVIRTILPVPRNNPETTRVHYPARIVPGKDENKPWARFKSCVNDQEYTIVKEWALAVDDFKKAFQCFEFLQQNATHIDDFETAGNWILQTWYDRFRRHDAEGLELRLRKMCPHLVYLGPILHYRIHGKPLYFVEAHLLGSDKTPYPLLMGEIPEQASRLTFEAVRYKAYELPEKSDRVLNVRKGWDWILAATTDLAQLQQHVRWFQKRMAPLAMTPEKAYHAWDPVQNKWLAMEEPRKAIKEILEKMAEILKEAEGYARMPLALRESFEAGEWLDALVEDVLSEVESSEIVGNVATSTDPMRDYGENVPEYYFFGQDIDFDTYIPLDPGYFTGIENGDEKGEEKQVKNDDGNTEEKNGNGDAIVKNGNGNGNTGNGNTIVKNGNGNGNTETNTGNGNTIVKNGNGNGNTETNTGNGNENTEVKNLEENKEVKNLEIKK